MAVEESQARLTEITNAQELVRGLPPTKEWLRLLSRPDLAGVLREHVRGQFQRGALELGSEGSSWPEDSLLVVGAGLDRYLSHLGLQVVIESGVRGTSRLTDHVNAHRAVILAQRARDRKIKRDAFLAASKTREERS